MSISRQGGGGQQNDAMADPDAPALSPRRDDDAASSSDGDTIKPDRDEDVADISEEEPQSPVTSVPGGVSSVKSRYRELAAAAQQDTASDDGSTDTIPRRVGSPTDSSLSIPDDSPSVQVGAEKPREP